MGDCHSKWVKSQGLKLMPASPTIIGMSYDKKGPMDFFQLITESLILGEDVLNADGYVNDVGVTTDIDFHSSVMMQLKRGVYTTDTL